MANRYYIPDDDAPSSTLGLLHQVARLSRNAMARELGILDLYPGQDRVIDALHQMQTATPGDLARMTGVSAPTITKTLVRLSERGLVERSTAAHDGRQVDVRLTDKGREIVRAMRKATKRVEKRTFAALRKKERKMLHALLETIRTQTASPPDTTDGI